MSVLLPILVFILANTFVIYGMSSPDQRLRVLSTFWLVMLLLTSSTIATEWSRMTNLVLDNDDPHNGLPKEWDGRQAVCFHFPEGNAPEGFKDGRHHLDTSGRELFVDPMWNETGSCVGGFEGYEIGMDLLGAAIDATGDSFSMSYTEFSFGIMIDSLGGIHACDAVTCSDDGTSGASWSLYHNGAVAMVGISDLALVEDSVLTWRIDTW